MKKILLIASLLLSSFGFVSGQSDTIYKATLVELFRVSNTEESYNVAIKQMFSMFKQQYTNVPSNIWDEFEAEMMKTSMTELVDMLVPVYIKYLTIDDLNEIIKFYESPIGKKYAEKNPLILQESMQVGQQWGMKIGTEFMNKIKEKGY